VSAEPQEAEIARLGAQGDGIVDRRPRPLYVPFALPGERWRVGGGADPVMLCAHPRRMAPVCRHFAACGGCVAQHMPDDIYAAWKRAMVVEAFRHRGIDAEVGPLLRVPPASRRRVTFYAMREGTELRLGFHRRAAHSIVDIAECPIAVAAIASALPALRDLMEPVLVGRAGASVHVLATPQGLDVHVDFARAGAPRRAYARLAALAARHGFARLTVGKEVVALARRPTLAFGDAAVEPPPAAFVQAVAEAEAEMIRLVTAAAAGARRVADLFCGIGTFALPLARRARVLAVDSREAAVAALGAAVRRASGLKPVETRVRDLFRTPLGPRELEGVDAVVLDPPAQGARAQATQLAGSAVPVVIYVSCDPGTLARDARILLDAGFALASVTPIDQFLYAHHVEAVAVLERKRSRRPR
jgi:23S rRNA (uracil1939-C5)-methyltransferase